MRNLVNVGHLEVDLGLPPDVGHVRFAAEDDENGVIYVAGSGLTIACVSATTLETLWTADIAALAPAAGCDLPSAAAPTALAYSPDLAALLLGLSSGHLLLLHPPAAPGAGAGALEEVGVLGGGVAAAGWAPDGDALAVLSGAGQLLLMNPEWEVLWEAAVADDAPAFPQPDAVPGPPPPPGAAPLPLGPGNAALSWRGDGKYLATCTIDVAPLDGSKTSHPARVRVWDREGGVLHALGVAAAGLRAVAAWQPNGRHLYVAQHNPVGGEPFLEAEGGGAALQNGNGAAAAAAERGPQGQAPEVRHVGAWKRELRRREAAAAAAGAAPAASHVLLFERNGLQHGGFDLPAPALGGDETGDGQAVEAMSWSPDSAVLAVVLGPFSSAEEERSGGGGCNDPAAPHRTLQLWHRSNWHWYIKFERRYPRCGGLTVGWASSPGGGLTLRALTAEGGAAATALAWAPCTSALGTAAVVDGAAVLLTPLREGIVPPPLCAAAVGCPAPPAALALGQRAADGREVLAAALSDGTVAVAGCVEEDLWEESLEEEVERAGGWAGRGPPRLLPRLLALPQAAAGRLVRQAAWVSDVSLLLVVAGSGSVADGGPGEDELLEIDVSAALEHAEAPGSSKIMGIATQVSCLPAPGRVVAVAAVAPGWPGGGAAVQLDTGEVWGYSPGGALESLPPGAAFPGACPRMAAPPPLAPGEAPLASPFAALGLSARGELWWGARQVASGVTSFALRHRGPGGAFLLFTTRAHTLRTLPLSSVFEPSLALAPSGAHEYAIPELKLAAAARRRGPGGAAAAAAGGDVTVRAIEEGSLLVACPAESIDAVYQAPRGNLETARPRALALPAAAAALDAADYAAAWRLATVNRLDLNVLVDYGWPRFLGQARAFLEGVASDVDAADFVAGLAPASVTAPGGLYAAALTALHVSVDDQPYEPPAPPPEDKVAAVCAAVRAAAEELRGPPGPGPAPWLRTKVTTHSRCGDLPAALRRIKAVREAELGGAAAAVPPPAPEGDSPAQNTAYMSSKTSATAEQGLRHLLLYRTEEEVYRAALGSYELELSYMVVTHSQRDPGEYLLQLQGFAAVGDPALRRHAIDAHLGRWPAALRALVDAGDAQFGAALALARERGLLRLLAGLVGPERRPAVHAAAGEELEGRGKHEDAALAYVAAGDLERALRAYRLAGAWRQALGLAARLGRDAERVAALAARLAADLADSHRHAEAAAVSLEYLGDVPQGVRLLTEGGEWAEAVRVAWARGRGDLVEGVIAPAAAAAASRLLENAREDAQRVGKYWARLRELRGKRAAVAAAVAAAEAAAEGLPGLGPRDDDLDTEAASLVSGMSAYTDATAAGGTALSSASATTVGGRRAGGGKKKKGKAGRASGRIRQGSPEEEAQLGRHLLALAPLTSTCTETGQLAEVLVGLGHGDDAATLQRALKTLADEQRAAVADLAVHPPPRLALMPSPGALERAAAAGGAAGVAALEAAAAEVPGGELARRVAEGEAAAKSGAWKWEVLREPEDQEEGRRDNAA